MNDELEQLETEGAELDDLHAPASEQPEAEAPHVEAEAEVSTADVINELLAPTFDLLAPAWEIKLEERRALADAYGLVLDKYFPAGISKWGAELNAIAVTVMVFYPRRGMDPLKKKAPPGEPPIDGEVVKTETGNGSTTH